MDMQFIPFKSWHLKLLKPGKYYEQLFIDPETTSFLYRKVEGLTILLDGEIAGIIGVVPLWNGVGEITMIPSDALYKYMKTFLRYAREFVKLTAETFNLHRVQATALVSLPRHGRFLKAIGLKQEGIMRGYGTSGEDMYMYSYIPVRDD